MKQTFNSIKRLPEFEKDLKKLKRFKSIEKDLKVFIKTQLNLYHKQKIDNKGIFPITNLKIEHLHIYKARKFACRSLKGKGVASGIRVIYAYNEGKDCIEFIEIYYKGDKKSEDKGRFHKVRNSYFPT